MRWTVVHGGGEIACEAIDHTPAWEGPPPTVLFHHGVGACGAVWDGWTPALADRFRLVRFDLRGHGASPLPPGFEWSLDSTVDDLGAVADAAGADRFHLVGESLGGTVALAYAARRPERVLSLTVSNGTHLGGAIENLEPWERLICEEGMGAWSAHMMKERFFDGALTPRMARWYEEQQASAEPGAILDGAAMLAGADLTPELAGVSCPVLLLHPDSSPFIPVETMAALRRALPDARLQVLAHARHGLPYSHAAECAAAVSRFLDGTAPGPA